MTIPISLSLECRIRPWKGCLYGGGVQKGIDGKLVARFRGSEVETIISQQNGCSRVQERR